MLSPHRLLSAFLPLLLWSCGNDVQPPSIDPNSPRAQAFLDTLEQRTFAYFWERTDPQTGLTPDRWLTP